MKLFNKRKALSWLKTNLERLFVEVIKVTTSGLFFFFKYLMYFYEFVYLLFDISCSLGFLVFCFGSCERSSLELDRYSSSSAAVKERMQKHCFIL